MAKSLYLTYKHYTSNHFEHDLKRNRKNLHFKWFNRSYYLCNTCISEVNAILQSVFVFNILIKSIS